MNPTDKYAYSFDNERYYGQYGSIREALDAAKVDYKNDDEVSETETVYIGRICIFEPIVDGYNVIERMQDYADFEADEACVDYLEDVSDEDVNKLEAMLTETFNKWAKETGNEPNFFTVEEVQEYSLEGENEAD